jgi:hypothetical protein
MRMFWVGPKSVGMSARRRSEWTLIGVERRLVLVMAQGCDAGMCSGQLSLLILLAPKLLRLVAEDTFQKLDVTRCMD